MCESLDKDTGQRAAPHGAGWRGRTLQRASLLWCLFLQKPIMVLKKEGRRKSLKFTGSEMVSN